MTCLKASLYSVDNTIATEQIWDGVEYMHWPVEFSFQKKHMTSSLQDVA